jgi:Flp pilus assembly pilin Flp
MKFFAMKFQRFTASEDGAVTVDWVVLTAAVCGLVVVAIAGLRGNMTSIGAAAGSFVGGQSINTTFN